MRSLLLLIAGGIFLTGCFDNYYIPPTKGSNLGNQKSSDWKKDYSALLQKYVHPSKGLVDYKGLLQDKAKLDGILLALKDVKPTGWDDNQKLAFWINAYNIGMLWNIVEKMQTDGEEVFETKKVIDFGDLFFKTRKFEIAGINVSLDGIENGLIRNTEAFRDSFAKDLYISKLRPEIHAAVSCAALSCPPIRNTIWKADTVDKELQDALAKVMNNKDFVSLDSSSGKPKMVQIFDWFHEDFKYNGQTVGEYLGSLVQDPKLKQALEQAGNDKEKLLFETYNWELNLWKK